MGIAYLIARSGHATTCATSAPGVVSRYAIAPLDQKKKAGGHYAADLILQLPAAGPVPLLAFHLTETLVR
jgi:hypothetical protein